VVVSSGTEIRRGGVSGGVLTETRPGMFDGKKDS
jgi:hypothetical protein